MKELIKGTSKLFVSNILAQGLSLLLLVVVCRKYYSPSDLELFTLFQSAMGFFGVLFILRFDTLFYIEKEKELRDLTYKLSLILIVGLSLLFFVVNLFFKLYQFDFTYNLLLLSGMVMIGFFNLSQSKLINEQLITIASLTRVTAPLINFIVSYALIVLGYVKHAMVIGLLVGLLSSLLIQLVFTRLSFDFEVKKSFAQLKKYAKDLLYSNLIFVINSFRDTLFILFISMMYSSKDYVASYSQALRIVSLPSLVLSGALGSVLGSQLKVDMENKEQFRQNYFKLLSYIGISALVIYLLAFVLMDFGVDLLFGKKWMYVSSCAKSMIPWLFMNFVLNALNGYFLVLRMQFVNLIVNLFETTFFLCTFLLLGDVYAFEETLFFASMWSLLFGSLLVFVLSRKILAFSKA